MPPVRVLRACVLHAIAARALDASAKQQWSAKSFGADKPGRPLRAGRRLAKQLAPMSQTTSDHAFPANKIAQAEKLIPNPQFRKAKIESSRPTFHRC